METLGWIIIILLTIIGSVAIGFFGAFFSNWLDNRKIKKNAKKFLSGERENKIQLDDGRVLDVHKFITFDDKEKKVIIDLKGGINIEHAKEKRRKREKTEQNNRDSRKISRGNSKDSRRRGEKKRANGKRIRRFRGV